MKLALVLGLTVPNTLPEVVAAVWLRNELNQELRLAKPASASEAGEEYLLQLASEAGLIVTFRYHDRDEVAAWIEAAWALKNADALTRLKPGRGDIVSLRSKDGALREISSVGVDGMLHYRGGRGGQKSWPQQAQIVARTGSSEYDTELKRAQAAASALPSPPIMHGSPKLNDLARFEVTRQCGPDAHTALAEALASAHDEKPIQEVITRFPELLTHLVDRNHTAYVVPKPQLGGDFEPDFVVAGITSRGIEWTLVELESPTAQIELAKGGAAEKVRTGMTQIKTWRRWLEFNPNFAMPIRSGGKGFAGLSANAHGLVIVSSSDLTDVPDHTRLEAEREQRIAVRSYKWLDRVTRTPTQLRFGALDLEWPQNQNVGAAPPPEPTDNSWLDHDGTF